MSRHAVAILLALTAAAVLPFWASAEDPTCTVYAKNDDGQWIARQDTTLPGKATPVKAGRVVPDDVQDELDDRCVLARKG
jgi:hypothetical protein